MDHVEHNFIKFEAIEQRDLKCPSRLELKSQILTSVGEGVRSQTLTPSGGDVNYCSPLENTLEGPQMT